MKKIFGIAITILTLLSGCSVLPVSSEISSSESSDSKSEIVQPTSISLSESVISLNVNTSIKLVATLLPINSVGTITWSSEDNTIAEVNNGVVKGLKKGETIVKAQCNTLSSECKVVVSENNEIKSGEVHLYAMNDFHGSVVPQGAEIGLIKNGSFFKNKKAEDNTLILNSGDMWQGSIESNSNYGEFLTKAMNNIGFDCFTLGNHEFDWGSKYISYNRSLKDDKTNYSTPFLGANIYNYDIETKSVLSHADDICGEYVIRTLENGLRVGIIGVIGEDQITSISSQFADDYTFTDPTFVIKNLSDELRINQNCDVVIVDAHASVEQINTEITNVSEVSNKKYADAVFCAHSHQYENTTINGVPFVQGSCNGKAYSEIHLSVNNGDVEVISASNQGNELDNIMNYDDDLAELYKYYVDIANEKGNEVLGTFNGYMSSSTRSNISVPKLVTKAIALEAINQNYNIEFAFCNQARTTIEEGELTYASLYKSLPFDNEIIIMEVSGEDILNQASKSTFYRVNDKSIESNKRYIVAVIDYLALHRNTNRDYNYFPSLKVLNKLSKTGFSIYNYRDITADYIRKEKEINVYNYSNSDSHYSLY